MLNAVSHAGRVKSPTYSLVEVYKVSRLHFYHFDFYRFTGQKNPRELEEVGFREYFNPQSVYLVEWPDTAAGLPPAAGEPVENVLPELERCVKMGFRGALLNPDPYENSGVEPLSLGDRYWYPLYEKLCELDVPMHIHSTGSHSERSPYTLNFINEETVAVYNLVQSDVFKDFPTLKVVCSHGGGAIPYQIGRFQSSAGRRGTNFLDGVRNIYYDTVLYSEEALRLLIKTVGADRCLFGSECPGVGSTIVSLTPSCDST